MQTIQGYREQINAVATTLCGRHFLTASNDKTIRLWRIENGVCLNVFRGHTKAVNAVMVTPDGSSFIFGSDDGTIKVWAFDKRNCMKTFSDQPGAIAATAVSADGCHIIAGRCNSTLQQWDLKSGECLQTFKSHPACQNMDGRNSLLRSSNSEFAYHDFIGHLGIARICREKGFSFPGHAGPVTAVTISANSRFFSLGKQRQHITFMVRTYREVHMAFRRIPG